MIAVHELLADFELASQGELLRAEERCSKIDRYYQVRQRTKKSTWSPFGQL